MKLPRRKLLLLGAGAASLGTLPWITRGQAYPSQPVRIVVGWATGLAPDIVARIIGEPLSRRLGQPVIVDNSHSSY